MTIAKAPFVFAIVRNMIPDDVTQYRKQRLAALATAFGGQKELGLALGYKDGAYVGQMISGHRPIAEKTIAKCHELKGFDGWFATSPDISLSDSAKELGKIFDSISFADNEKRAEALAAALNAIIKVSRS